MPLTLVTGPANAGKAQVVLDQLRAHVAAREEPVLVVPTRADADHYMRELAGGGAAMGARVERFRGVIELAVAAAGTDQPLLGRAARERLIARAAAEHGLAVGAAPVLVRALAEAIAELRARRVAPHRLKGAFSRWESQAGPQAASVLGRIYETYVRMLAGCARTDAEGRALAALDALREHPALWRRRPVLFYGFDDLTPLELDVIETLARVVDAPVTVSLAFEPGRLAFAGRAGTYHALAPLAAEERGLAARVDHYAAGARHALSHMERSLFEGDAARIEPGSAVALLEGSGERAELELVAGEVSTLLEQGMAPEAIAIVRRGGTAEAALLAEILRARGIPFAMPLRRPLRDSATGAALIGLLRCAGAEREATIEDLLAWLRAPGVLERPELADALEARARRRGVSDAAGARAIWEQANWPLDALERVRRATADGPRMLLERAERELRRLFAAPRRAAAAVLAADELDDARALAAAARALGELHELAVAAPRQAPLDAEELARELERVEFDSGQPPGPGAVTVADPLSLRARRVRALFLCGLQEGAFPRAARSEPFLGAEERRGLAAAGLLLGEERDTLAAERYLLYAVLSRPEELLRLSWHLADDDGESTPRSLFVDDVCDLFTAQLESDRHHSEPAGRGSGVGGPGAGAPVSPARVGMVPLREPATLAALAERPWSASSLELWIRCPARWFIERMLDPRDLDPTAEPLSRGALAHAVLSDVLEGLRLETGSARLSPGRLARALELLGGALAVREQEFPLSVAAERVPSSRRRLLADLERFLRTEAERESPLEPVHLERGFGFAAEETDEAEPLPALELGEGMRLRGRIDRIDVDGRGRAIVYDYKSAKVPIPDRWATDGNLQVPLYMRAAGELLGLEVVGGFYQPLSGEDLRPRGVLDADAGIELECVRGDLREGDAVSGQVEEAMAAARAAAREAASGALESRPSSCGWNGSGCAYPTICRCEQ